MKRIFLLVCVVLNLGTAFADQTPRTSTGFDIITSRESGNCIACHEVPGVEGRVSNFGPSLQGVGRKWSSEELRKWVKDARKINPNTLMPPFGTLEGLNKVNPSRVILSDAQITQVVDTLQSWQ
jgi:sulfur-oxidizing protein SoxX